MRTLLVFLSAALLSAGCKDKPKAQPPSTGSQTAVGSGSGSGAKPPDTPLLEPRGSGAEGPKVVTLPKADGTPPKKTAKPLTKDILEKLSKLEYDSFTRDVKLLSDKVLEVQYLTKDRPKIAAIVNVGPCFDCMPMDVAKWQAKKDGLKIFLVQELREHKDTVFEVGGTDLHGAKMIYVYQLGWAFGKDPDTDQMMGAYSHAYIAIYNDGVNQIRVIAQYADDPVKTRDDMVALAPKEDLEKFAKSFLDAYTHAWAN